MSGFKHLNDELLIESFRKAINLNLEDDFIQLLIEEIMDRGILLDQLFDS